MAGSPEHWYDKRQPMDSPGYPEESYEYSLAWAAGWNAAVEACVTEQAEVFARELANLGFDGSDNSWVWEDSEDESGQDV